MYRDRAGAVEEAAAFDVQDPPVDDNISTRHFRIDDRQRFPIHLRLYPLRPRRDQGSHNAGERIREPYARRGLRFTNRKSIKKRLISRGVTAGLDQKSCKTQANLILTS